MPNRILRESICDSESISRMSWFEEVMFYRLLVSCDDFGRLDARLKLLCARLFPLRDVSEQEIEQGLLKLSELGSVFLYKVDDKPYLQVTNWSLYQRLRQSRAKYPAPPQCAATCGESRPESESESESQSESISESESEPRARGTEEETMVCFDSNEPCYPDGVALPTAGGGTFLLPDVQAKQLLVLYPDLDLPGELRRMAGWLYAHGDKQRAAGQMPGFVSGWVGRVKPGTSPPTSAKQPAGDYRQRQYESDYFDGFFAMGERNNHDNTEHIKPKEA